MLMPSKFGWNLYYNFDSEIEKLIKISELFDIFVYSTMLCIRYHPKMENILGWRIYQWRIANG